jgi:hypothetical protein
MALITLQDAQLAFGHVALLDHIAIFRWSRSASD